MSSADSPHEAGAPALVLVLGILLATVPCLAQPTPADRAGEERALPAPRVIRLLADRQSLPEPITISLGAERQRLPEPNAIHLAAQRQDVPEPHAIRIGAERRELPDSSTIRLTAERKEVPEPLAILVTAERQEVPQSYAISIAAQRQEVPEPLTILVAAERQEMQEPVPILLTAERQANEPESPANPQLPPLAPPPVEPQRPAEPRPTVDCSGIEDAQRLYDASEDRFFCACSDGWPVPPDGRCPEPVTEVDCSTVRGSQKQYDPLTDSFICACPDGLPPLPGSDACPEPQVPVDCERFAGARKVFNAPTGRIICVCPDDSPVDERLGRCPEPPTGPAAPDPCVQFNVALQNAPNPATAVALVRQAQQAGCHVPAGLIAAVNSWNQQTLDANRRRREDGTRALGILLGGLNQIIQMQGGGSRPSPTFPGLPTLPSGGTGDPVNQGTTSRPSASAGGDCQQVCAQWVLEWQSSDGRHQTCCAGGRRNPNCIDVTCSQARRCVRWENRCP